MQTVKEKSFEAFSHYLKFYPCESMKEQIHDGQSKINFTVFLQPSAVEYNYFKYF